MVISSRSEIFVQMESFALLLLHSRDSVEDALILRKIPGQSCFRRLGVIHGLLTQGDV